MTRLRRDMTRWRVLEFRPLGHPIRPRMRRYQVAHPGYRFVLNTYPGSVIGVAVVLGRWAYSLQWARPARYEPVR